MVRCAAEFEQDEGRRIDGRDLMAISLENNMRGTMRVMIHVIIGLVRMYDV